ncbi:uncharacterized protein CDAR_60561, partial [Caerostris darwini]
KDLKSSYRAALFFSHDNSKALSCGFLHINAPTRGPGRHCLRTTDNLAMHYLTVFLLVCVGVASALPRHDEFEINEYSLRSEGGGRIGERMKEMFEKLVERLRKGFEDGKGVREDLMKKANDIFEKLKNLKVEISEKVKSVFEDLRGKMGRNSPAFDAFLQDAEMNGQIGERLREMFENFVNKIKDGFDQGKGVRGDLMKKAEDIYNKLKNMGVEISDKIKSIFEDLRSKVSRSGPMNSGFGDRLQELLEKIVKSIKEKLDQGQEISSDMIKKAEDLIKRMKNLGIEISDEMKDMFEEIKAKMNINAPMNSGIGDRLQQHLEKIVKIIKEKLDQGQEVSADLIKKAEDIFNRMKNLGIEISDEMKDMFEEIKAKMGLNGATSANADISNIFDILKRLKKMIKEKFDADELKAKVESMFGKGSELAEQLINMLKEKGEKGKKKILDWIDRILPDKEERSISEVYEKIRDYFRDLNIELKERFTKFGEWVKDQYQKGLEKGKSKAENIRRIAKEFIEDTRAIGKDMAQEALDFFREYKKDLGKLYDNVVDKARDILKS